MVGANWADPEGENTEGDLSSIASPARCSTASDVPQAQRHAAAVTRAKTMAARYASSKKRR